MRASFPYARRKFYAAALWNAERPGEEQKRVPRHEQQEQDGHGGMEVAGGELHGLGHECAIVP